jgi:hypothetical protein
MVYIQPLFWPVTWFWLRPPECTSLACQSPSQLPSSATLLLLIYRYSTVPFGGTTPLHSYPSSSSQLETYGQADGRHKCTIHSPHALRAKSAQNVKITSNGTFTTKNTTNTNTKLLLPCHCYYYYYYYLLLVVLYYATNWVLSCTCLSLYFRISIHIVHIYLFKPC